MLVWKDACHVPLLSLSESPKIAPTTWGALYEALGCTVNMFFFPEKMMNLRKLRGTVDGQNPAPPRMMIIPLFIGF